MLSNQKGAVMLLVAMLASVLLMLASLAIDSAVISNSKVQQRHAAEYMALGSIKAFNEDINPSPLQKLNTATLRAQQLARENDFLAKSFIKNPTSEMIGNNQTSGTHGQITPGIWYFKEGTGVCNGLDAGGNPLTDRPSPCPCDSGNNNNWAAPCFRELNLTSTVDAALTPNATRVELKTSSSSPIQTLFARVKGQDTIDISSTATAVQLPRRGVFLIDLSRHSHDETHTPYPIACSTSTPPRFGASGCQSAASEYSFKTSMVCSTPWTVLCPNRLTCAFNTGGTGANPNDLYSTLYNGRYRPAPASPLVEILAATRGGSTINTLHYKDDYRCFQSPTFSELMPGGVLNPASPFPIENYLVDSYFVNASPGVNKYDGAEPLNTMLVGLHEAVQQFKNNIVPGDEITVIGFDGSAGIDVRTLGPIPINSGTAAQIATFNDLENLSNIDFADPTNVANNDLYRTARFINHMFFPRVDDVGMDKQKNIVEALIRAKEILISAGNTTSENFVTLISDGISSCYETTNSTEKAAVANLKRCDTPSGSGLCSVCSTSYAGFMNSFEQIEKIINQDFIPNNIKFHFLQIGQRSMPHNLQRVKVSGSTKTCMSVDEMDASNPPRDTIDPTFELTGASTTFDDEFKKITYGTIRFPIASDLGRLAKESKGKYFPIRNPCQAGVDNTATANADCNNIALNNGDLVINGIYSDSRGRVTCDIAGKSRRQQMREAIAEVFNEDPYIIVD